MLSLSMFLTLKLCTPRSSTIVYLLFLLDSIYHFSFEGLRLYSEHKHFEYVLPGKPEAMITKLLLPFFSGSDDASAVRFHRSELRGRLARWNRLETEDWDFVLAACVGMVLFLRAGFDFKSIKRIWFGVIPHCFWNYCD